MRAMSPKDFHFDAGSDAPTPGFSSKDPFMTGKLAARMPPTRLNQCMSCHRRAGGRGVRTRNFRGTHGFFVEANQDQVAKATAANKLKHDEYKTLLKYWRGEKVELPKPTEKKMTKKKTEPKPDRFPDTPKLRAALFTRVTEEITKELKTLHTAVQLAEVAKLGDMFKLGEADTKQLRQAAQEAATTAVEKAHDSIQESFKFNFNHVIGGNDPFGNKNDPDLTAFRFNDKFIMLDVENDDRDPAKRNRYDSLGFKLARQVYSDWLRVGFRYGSHGNTVRPRESDVRSEASWKNALAAVLSEKQIKQYAEHTENRLNNTIVDLMLTTLQFDLDLDDSQLPAIRKRIEERVKVSPTMYGDVESSVGPQMQRLKADGLGDILTEKQLNAFPEHPKSKIKSTVVTLILTELKFDLHLADSHLPALRKRLEERVDVGGLSSSVVSKAMRLRWRLKEKDFADVLTESELVLWRYTQEQHN